MRSSHPLPLDTEVVEKEVHGGLLVPAIRKTAAISPATNGLHAKHLPRYGGGQLIQTIVSEVFIVVAFCLHVSVERF